MNMGMSPTLTITPRIHLPIATPTQITATIPFYQAHPSRNVSPASFPSSPQITETYHNECEIKRSKNSPCSSSKESQTPPPLIVPRSSSAISKLSASSTPKSKSTPNPKNYTNSHNLIDFAQADDKNSVRVSILQEFDPLSDSYYSSSSSRTISPDYSGDDALSVCESVYEEYDPYDFIYHGSGNNSVSDPIYATISRPDSTPLSPAAPRMSTIDRRSFKNVKRNLLKIIEDVSHKSLNKDPDLKAFYNMVYNVRKQYRYNDPDTNMGLVISPMVSYQYTDGLSIKLQVHPDFEGRTSTSRSVLHVMSKIFTVTTSVEHVTLQLTYDLEAPTTSQYTLKVWGSNEYLVPTTLLSDYEYVHDCIKLDEDVVLILIPDSKKDKSFARTIQDDNDDETLKFDKIIPYDSIVHISYESLEILLETVENEMQKLEEAALQMGRGSNASVMPSLQPLKVIQSVKCIINLMGDLCTLDIMQTVEALMESCRNFLPSNVQTLSFSEAISSNCNKIRFAIQNLIEMYVQAFTVDFDVKSPLTSEPTKYVHDVIDSVILRICAIYRPAFDWEYEEYYITAQIYHGTKKIGRALFSQPSKKTERDQLWPSRIVLEFEDVPINSLARESRLVLQVFGKSLANSDSEDAKNSSAPVYREEEIGWAAVQFFNYEGIMSQGSILLSIWPKDSNYINDHIYGPAPAMGTHPEPDHCMIGIEIVTPTKIQFPTVSPELYSNVIKGDFSSLDNETQQLLIDACEQDMLYKFPPEIREILWEKRHYLYHLPQALPKVLLAAHSWAYVQLPDLHGMLHTWARLKPIQALELLLPVYPDLEVRKFAVRWVRGLTNDELVDYLPQLVVALRHETYENSPLAQFLLDRALRSPRFAHHLFWLLCHSLPGDAPQNCMADIRNKDDPISEVRHHRRLKLLLRALLAICGKSLGDCFLSQQSLVKRLNDVAEDVQKTKESHRLTVLHNALGQIHKDLQDNPTSLPLSPTLRVTGVEVQTSSYFPSNTLPLKINFVMEDSSIRPAIYKVGDDLQQDMLTLQMIRLMDKLWLNWGLDLRMVAFTCIPTSKKKGMIEMVTKAETLRKIQVEHGLTGSFKDKPIAEWLAKHNPSELEYGRAVQNFTASCAGYCVITYILGICDRHNDNIMLKTSGHLFHIDYGKFLGDAQMFGNFKRDRAPFVLTSDMAYVINGGDRPTEKFHQFVDLCCQAFNIIRNHRNLFCF
ncbi:hypothetical protein NQ318_017485 [Aromia moschata]|uniref:phosphatidylinositol 3-kinase n=1 Tax=Aromia moschata TaxID=1265417 RepID=A0AAV8Z4E5_9CUCU|nr:hypothetical protein NQ318_017485 [Aromia moschata]